MKLDNWAVVGVSDSPYSAPEQCTTVIVGNVYGNPRFSDGEQITSSRLLSITINVAKTFSGSVYELGDPNKMWLQWLDKNGYTLDEFLDK